MPVAAFSLHGLCHGVPPVVEPEPHAQGTGPADTGGWYWTSVVFPARDVSLLSIIDYESATPSRSFAVSAGLFWCGSGPACSVSVARGFGPGGTITISITIISIIFFFCPQYFFLIYEPHFQRDSDPTHSLQKLGTLGVAVFPYLLVLARLIGWPAGKPCGAAFLLHPSVGALLRCLFWVVVVDRWAAAHVLDGAGGGVRLRSKAHANLGAKRAAAMRREELADAAWDMPEQPWYS